MSYRILLLEGSEHAAEQVAEALRQSFEQKFELTHVLRLDVAMERVRRETFDVILSDLKLPDSQGLATVRSLQRAAPYCPIVIVAGTVDDDMAVSVLREGADDYLIKGEVSGGALARAVRHAIERRQTLVRAEAALEEEARIIATLHRIGTSLTSELDLQRVVQLVTDEATALISAAFGAFFYNVKNAEGDAYMLYTLSGVPREAFASFPMPRNTPVFAPTFSGEGIVRSEDITQDPRYGRMPPHHGMPAGHLPVRSYLAVPVVSRRGDVIGGLFFGHPEPARFSEREERIASGIAGWAAVAVDNARLYDGERRARAEAERANRVKAEFLATMSHELRTPLNAMIGYTDLWLEGLPITVPEPMQPQVERVRRSAYHLLSLIDEILTFSRLEAGQEVVDLEPILLHDQVETVATFIEPLAMEKRLKFSVQAPTRAITMVTDARKLRQILINLLSNAVKFTTAGEVRLTVEERAGEIFFSVIDTGRGIARAEQERVFEPFIQASDVAGRPEGTGLGLSVSRRLARMLGGDVTVVSEVGEGSTFTVQLPTASVASPSP